MFKSKMIVTLAVLTLIGSLGAWGADYKVSGQVPGQDSSRQIPYEELRGRCENPQDYDVQRSPQNIKLQCTDIRREWVPAAPGEVPLPGFRRVITAVFADKFHVGAQPRDVPIFSKSGTCQRFKEVEKTLTIERPLSCAEIIGMKGTVEEFCTSALDAAKAANPKLIEVREIEGRVIDTCGGLAGTQPK